MKKTLMAVAITFYSTGALAQTGGALGAKVSTLGLGLEYTFPVYDQFDAGININYAGYTYDKNYAKKGYKAEGTAQLRLFTLGATGYYYPFQNSSTWWHKGFNVNGGMYFNGNQVDVKANAKELPAKYRDKGVSVNGQRYEIKPSDIRDAGGTLTFNRIAPYIGIGWKSKSQHEKGLAFDANLGLLFHGTPQFEERLECAGNLAIPGDTLSRKACNTIKEEAGKKLREEQNYIDTKEKVGKYFKAWPVASVGFTYRF